MALVLFVPGMDESELDFGKTAEDKTIQKGVGIRDFILCAPRLDEPEQLVVLDMSL